MRETEYIPISPKQGQLVGENIDNGNTKTLAKAKTKTRHIQSRIRTRNSAEIQAAIDAFRPGDKPVRQMRYRSSHSEGTSYKGTSETVGNFEGEFPTSGGGL